MEGPSVFDRVICGRVDTTGNDGREGRWQRRTMAEKGDSDSLGVR